MKLKTVDLNGQTYAEVQDGKPVFVDDDGKDVPVDVANTRATIARLNAEAKSFREAKEAAEARLKPFEGIEDAEAARKAMEALKNIDEGKLIQAGKVEEIKAAAAKAAEDRVAAQSKVHADELAKLRKEHDSLIGQYHGEKIGGAFNGSKFITEKAAIPADMMQARFGSAFKVEEGRLIGYDQTGNKIFSRVKPGEVAEFDEAIEMLVDQYPYKDNILRGNNNGGGGSRGGSGGAGAKTISRAEFEKLNPAAQMIAMTKDGLTVVD